METFWLIASPFFGVLLAFLLGTWGQSAQRKHVEDEQRHDTVKSILAELNTIQEKVVTLKESRTDYPTRIPIMHIFYDALASAVSSGRFALLDVDLQTDTSSFYSVLRILEKIMGQGYLQTELYYVERKPEMDWVIQNLDLILEELRNRIPPLIDQLNKSPKPLSTWDHMMADLG